VLVPVIVSLSVETWISKLATVEELSQAVGLLLQKAD